MDSSYFNTVYQTEGNPWGTSTSDIVEQHVELLQGSTVLDIGAGDGRNTLYLAEHGFTVHALDFAATGLKNLMEKARSRGVDASIVPITADFMDYQADTRYDNIISTFTLHFAGESNLIPFLNKAMELTKPGGVMIVEDFTANSELVVNSKNYIPTAESLREHYVDAGWHIHHSATRMSESRQRNAAGEPYINEAAGIVAQKPPL